MQVQGDSNRDRIVSNTIQKILSVRFEPQRRKNLEALIHVYEGRFKSATRVWIDLLKEFPRHSRGLTNFGYYLFHLGTTSQCERALERLDFVDMVERGTPATIKFYLSLMLAAGHNHAEQAVERHFLDRIVEPNVSGTSGGHSVFFWHIPKCAGTSVSQVLGDYFYDVPLGEVLPSYSTLPLLTHCTRHRLQRFPFFSSSHQGVSVLGDPNNTFEFAILRDPLKRVLSMFRQTLNGLHNGYPLKILPKYGHIWNYWQASDAEGMLKAIPEELLLRQLSTFSETLDEDEAERKIGRLDGYLRLDGDRDFDDLFDEIGVDVQASDMERLSSSPKHIPISEKVRDRIKKRLGPEYRLLERIDSS
jgi:hypothetical protein